MITDHKDALVKVVTSVDWRTVGQVAVYAAGVVGAIACGAMVLCGVAVGAAAGFIGYGVRTAGTGEWNPLGAARETAMGGLLGGAQFVGRGLVGAKAYGSSLLGRSSAGFGRAYGGAGVKGRFNQGSLRTGWGWNGRVKKEVFRTTWSTAGHGKRLNHIDWLWK